MRLFGLLIVMMLGIAMPGHAARVQEVAMRPPAAAKQSASEVISNFYRTLEVVMKEGDKLGFEGRAHKLEEAVTRTFSASDMTRVSYGPSWVQASPEQKDKLTRAFHNFTVANYASQFKTYDGEEFTVTGEKPAPNANQRIVETTLKSGKDTHQLNYLMVNNGNGWQVADVFVDGAISEMATRRSEFGSVIRASGADGLLNVLEQKSKQLAQ
ncbi:MAG: ABC transporter substrate-binding protein [Alphaproteobacteria bacterium]|nr:ABC transporter substrate-binding protein [Alphaproteobacteria bacterium]